jgi:hypothetical protein
MVHTHRLIPIWQAGKEDVIARSCEEGKTMFTVLTLLTAIISIMFIVSVASTIQALRRESEEMKQITKQHKAF